MLLPCISSLVLNYVCVVACCPFPCRHRRIIKMAGWCLRSYVACCARALRRARPASFWATSQLPVAHLHEGSSRRLCWHLLPVLSSHSFSTDQCIVFCFLRGDFCRRILEPAHLVLVLSAPRGGRTAELPTRGDSSRGGA